MIWKLTCLKCGGVSHMNPRGDKPEFGDLKCHRFDCLYPLAKAEQAPEFRVTFQ